MKNSFIQVSKKAYGTKLTQYAKNLSRLFALPGVAFALLSILLLLTSCQPMVDEAPQPNNSRNGAAGLQATNINGVVLPPDFYATVLPSGEIINMFVPANWNGELILYAPGYTPAFEPLHIADEVGTYAPLFIAAGYAFATTSYSLNGLAVQTGIQDMINLRNMFIERYGMPDEIYLTGGSEGGLITTLAIERYPDLWSGGLSLCGPCGDFQRQVNYYGDFRVLFDYFFPGVLPGDVLNIPAAMIVNWQTVYVPAILQAIALNPLATLKLLNTAGAPYDPANPATIAQTVIGVLTYNLFLPDAENVLGGQPYFNIGKIYAGTGSASEDMLLNANIQRYSADKEATKNIKKFYETSGNFKKPLVKAHTTLDPIDLFWNLELYQDKVPNGKKSLFAAIPVQRYGHCTFTVQEIVAIFGQLLQRVEAQKQHPLAKVKGAGAQSQNSATKAGLAAVN